ncbi:MAG: translation elongation factor-like protein [Acidobacteria bacterium]|nr:translation elongation factor-like protein [Acidobacteriota bacterium]
MSEHLVGEISHFYNDIGVAGIDVSDVIHTGDVIHITGHTSDFTQTVGSIEIDHTHVEEAAAGDSIGLKVIDRARVHDEVFVVDD